MKRGIWILPTAVAALIFISVVLNIQFLTVPRVNSDAFYYLTVARNAVETGAFTYDGIHSTTGFHWLWMAVVLGIIRGTQLAGADLQTVPATLLLCCTFLYAATGGLLSYVALTFCRGRAVVTRFALLLPLFVALDPYLINSTVNGLETSLFLFILMAMIAALNGRRLECAFVLFQLLVLCRIESAVLAPYLAWIAFRESGTKRTVFLILSIPWAAGAVGFLDYWVDGTLASSSSLAKQYWAALAFRQIFSPLSVAQKLKTVLREISYLPSSPFSMVNHAVREAGLFATALSALLVISVTGMWRSCADRASRLLVLRAAAPLIWFSAVSFVAYKSIYFTPRISGLSARFAVFDYQSSWYFAPHTLLILVFLHIGLSLPIRRLTFPAASVLFLVLGWFVFLKDIAGWRDQGASSQGCRAPSPGLMIAQNDDGFAFKHRAQIMLLDGLVTGRNFATGERYLSIVKGGGIDPYLRKLRPRYVRVGTTMLLRNVGASESVISEIEKSPVVSLCEMGDWFELSQSALTSPSA